MSELSKKQQNALLVIYFAAKDTRSGRVRFAPALRQFGTSITEDEACRLAVSLLDMDLVEGTAAFGIRYHNLRLTYKGELAVEKLLDCLGHADLEFDPVNCTYVSDRPVSKSIPMGQGFGIKYRQPQRQSVLPENASKPVDQYSGTDWAKWGAIAAILAIPTMVVIWIMS